MEIKLNAETDEKETTCTLTNEHMNGATYIEIEIEDIAYTISVEELYQATLVFENIRKNHPL